MASEEQLSRRRFLKLGLAAGAAVASGTALGGQVLKALGQAVSGAANKAGRLLPAFAADTDTFGRLIGADGQPIEAEAPALARASAPELRRWVMVIDLARCEGCRLCTEACSAMHLVPPLQEWITVLRMHAHAGE